MKTLLALAPALLLPCVGLQAGPLPPKGVVETAPAPKAWELALSLETGWRQDQFQWTIAGDLSGRDPNILSDLEWSDLEIIPATLTADVTLRDHWRVQLSGSYGWIVDGSNRDSDYFFNNRRGEFSRSSADTDGRTIDAGFAIGYDIPLAASRVKVTPWVGLNYHQQHLNDTNGVQQVDRFYGDLGPFSGLNSTYEAEWYGVTFGLDATVRLSDSTRLLLGARYELAEYEAEADWNLRTDFDGFNHDADGDGWRLTAGFEWDFARAWTLGIHADWWLFQTDAGVDHTRFSDGTSVDTRLNEVEWESVGVRIGVTHRF